MSNRRKSAFEDGKALKLKLEQLIDGHKAAAAYCMTYNNMAAWLHTMSAATTVALSALLQASDANKNAIGITLIVLTAFTTGVSFWQNICRFASRFTDHSTAISRYRGLLAKVNDMLARYAPDKMAERLQDLLHEKESGTRVSPSIPPWITGNMHPGNNPGTMISYALLWLCNCLCGSPSTSEDAQVTRGDVEAPSMHGGARPQSEHRLASNSSFGANTHVPAAQADSAADLMVERTQALSYGKVARATA